MSGGLEDRLKRLEITLPNTSIPLANYVPYRRSGSTLHIAGQVSITTDRAIIGKVGKDLSMEEGYMAARLCGLNILAQLKAALGDDIDRAKAIKLGGFVNASPDFIDSPAIINGASDLIIELMGEESGEHTRFAVGVSSLPGGAAVEVDATFEIL